MTINPGERCNFEIYAARSIAEVVHLEKRIGEVVIEIVQGNIVDQPDLDAIVNAANARLKMGGGVAGAIHRAAGPGLERECRPLAPIEPGEAVISGGHNLPNKHVIHCLGPRYGIDKPEAELLSNCYSNALKRAEENDLSSIGFCAISTGVFGYPLGEASEVALRTVIDSPRSLAHVKLIRFVLFGEHDAKVHEEALMRVLG